MKVFTTFGSLGGSSEGYKRLGYEVIAYNEIDKKFFNFYVNKNNPKYGFNCDIRDLLDMELPSELYNIDILDGSPPCSLFSVANTKADSFKGKAKKFKEGQKEQILDDLVYIYRDFILKITPKIFIFENVPGILHMKNKKYLNGFLGPLEKDYNFCFRLVNSSDLGLAQSRERVFIFGIKKEFCLYDFMGYFDIRVPMIKEKLTYQSIEDTEDSKEILGRDKSKEMWNITKQGENFQKASEILYNKSSFFNFIKVDKNKALPSLTTVKHCYFHPDIFRNLNQKEYLRAFGLPEDYLDNSNINYSNLGYIVPPIFYEKLIPEVLKNTKDII